MRIFPCVLALTVCGVALAQSPNVSPRSGQPEWPAVMSESDFAANLVADTLYMCAYQYNSPLYKVSASNGKATEVGSMDLDEVCTDLAFRKTAASGTQLFGTSFTNLFLINPATGKATLLPDAYGSAITDINALVAQPGTGILYGAGSNPPGDFIEISPTTGKGTVKGHLGTGIGSAGDLEFLDGQLYALVNRDTDGSETFLAKISLSSGTMGKATDLLPIRQNIEGNLVTLDNVWGLANRGGVLYAVLESGDVITIDPATGMATPKGDNYVAQAGLAVVP